MTMAFTHRSWRSPHTDATQTTDRPSRNQNRRFRPTGLILPSMEQTPAGARGQGRGAGPCRSRRSKGGGARSRNTKREEPSSPHNRQEQPNIRSLIFPLFKALPAGNRHQSWASPSAGRSPSHIVLTLWPYTQYLTRRRPSLRSAQAPHRLEGWVTLTAPVARPSRRRARHGSSG